MWECLIPLPYHLFSDELHVTFPDLDERIVKQQLEEEERKRHRREKKKEKKVSTQ